jgi:hypothetical protein
MDPLGAKNPGRFLDHTSTGGLWPGHARVHRSDAVHQRAQPNSPVAGINTITVQYSTDGATWQPATMSRSAPTAPPPHAPQHHRIRLVAGHGNGFRRQLGEPDDDPRVQDDVLKG